MYTAMLTVENIHGATHDIWAVNVEEEYHEEGSSQASSSSGTGRDAPILPRRTAATAGPTTSSPGMQKDRKPE